MRVSSMLSSSPPAQPTQIPFLNSVFFFFELNFNSGKEMNFVKCNNNNRDYSQFLNLFLI